MITNEDVKKYWDSRPCNVRHSLAPIGTKEYFDQVEAKKFFVEPHILTFTNFPQWRNKKVLEIGCGIGTAAIMFARNGAYYTGIDISPESIKLAEKRFDVYGVKGNFYTGDAEKLLDIIPYDQFDLIYSFGVLHHTNRPEKVLDQIASFMKKDTILKIMLYARNSYKNYLIEAGLEQPEAQAGCPIAETYSKDEVFDLLKDFDIMDIHQDHIFPYEIESYKNGIYKKLPWFESMPDDIFKVLEEKLGWHTLVTARLRY